MSEHPNYKSIFTRHHAIVALKESIKVFDEGVEDPTPMGKLGMRNFYGLRTRIILPLLTEIRKDGKITREQQDTMIDQLNSPDRENWLVVFMMVDQLLDE